MLGLHEHNCLDEHSWAVGPNNKQRCRHPQSTQTWEKISFWQCELTPLVIASEVQNQLFTSQILPVRRISRLNVAQGNMGTAIYRVRLHPCCSPIGSNDLVFKCFDFRTVGLFENEAEIYESISRKSWVDSKGASTLPKSTPLLSSSSITRYFGSFVVPSCKNWPHHKSDAERDITSVKRRNKTSCEQQWCETTGKTHVIVLEYAAGGTLAQFCERNSTLLRSPDWNQGLFFWHQMFNILLGLGVIHGLGM